MPQTIGNNKYTLGKVIASGSFGKVYSSFPYAIKQIKLPNANETHQNFIHHFKTTLQNQINILKEANHSHIVKLYEVIYENDAVYLVMEYCQSDLKMKTINKAQGETKSIDIIGQILKGIKEMVKLGIVHRDLKPANILFHKGIYKIADFGMAKYLQTSENCMLKSHVGTPYYMAPQILQRKQYTPKCDVWSLGVIFYELVYGKLPWTGKDEKSLLSNILNHKLNFLPHTNISNQTKQILSKMLCISEHKRVSWQQLFVLFQILQKKSEPENKATFHRTVVEAMLNIEKDRISLVEYKCKFSELTNQKIVQVFRILEGLIDPEYGYIVRDFFKKCN